MSCGTDWKNPQQTHSNSPTKKGSNVPKEGDHSRNKKF